MSIIFITQKLKDEKNVQSFANEFYKILKEYNEKVFTIVNQNRLKNYEKEVYFINNIFDNRLKLFNKINKVFNFYYLVLKLILKNNINIIFVHQIDLFIFLSFPLKIFGIKIYYWRAHTSHKFKETLCYYICDKIISTNKKTVKIIERFKKKYVLTGHLINKTKDNQNFKINNDKKNINIIIFGRISKIKNIDSILLFIKKYYGANKKQINVYIYGPYDYSKNDKFYFSELNNISKIMPENIKLFFRGTVIKQEILSSNILFDFSLNFSLGALDKTIIELINYNIPTFSTNEAYGEEINFENFNNFFFNKSEISLYKNIEIYLKLSNDQKINYIKKLKYFINVNNNLENTLNIIFNMRL